MAPTGFSGEGSKDRSDVAAVSAGHRRHGMRRFFRFVLLQSIFHMPHFIGVLSIFRLFFRGAGSGLCVYPTGCSQSRPG